MASTPRTGGDGAAPSRRRRAVEFEVAPATTGTRPATTSIVISTTCSHSSLGQRRRFAGSAAGDEKIDLRFDLPGNERTQSRFVNRAVTLKWSYQRCAASTQDSCGSPLPPEFKVALLFYGARTG